MAEFKLSRPVQFGSDMLETLDVREPTAKDIKVLGFPLNADKKVDTAIVYSYVSRLAAIPPSTVDQISATDFIGLMALIIGFFGGSPD